MGYQIFAENHVYGSSRLGLVERNLVLVKQISETSDTLYYSHLSDSIKTFYRGEKRYELSNHLGNVLAVITDRRIQACGAGDVMYYNAQIVSVSDYYPFGMQIKEREWSDSTFSYRFAFNGKEQDNEVSGNGNSYDYGFRIYNPRLGKFLSVDPLFKSYPWYTPYQFAGNTPIWAIDIDGLEAWAATRKWPVRIHKMFTAYVSGENVVNTKIRRTCEDLAIGFIIDFAATNGLQLKLTDTDNENKIYDSNSTKYKNITQFKNEVMEDFYAENLRNSGIFTNSGSSKNKDERENIQTGDVLFHLRNNGRASHVQVVKEHGTVTKELLETWTSEGKTHLTDNFKEGDKYAKVIQGGFAEGEELKWYIEGQTDPADEDYIGAHPREAYYNLTEDTYVKDGYGKNSATANWSESQDHQISRITPANQDKENELKKGTGNPGSTYEDH
jgi:RHS repeat-associated protein